jgi:hypothetical protein
MKFFALALLCLLSSCVTENYPSIPDPASSVKRSDSIRIAQAYANLTWIATQENVKHGIDHRGIPVHTPDLTLADQGFRNGWWVPGQTHVGMAYQWGGFDTPKTYLQKIQRGYAVGDIVTDAKRAQGDAATSYHATGIDCSGFVSRCWRLSRSYSTAQLPEITAPIRWGDLQPGDILLKPGHVLLFGAWKRPGSLIIAYEAGPFPKWKVSCNFLTTERLIGDGFEPRRYLHIISDSP